MSFSVSFSADREVECFLRDCNSALEYNSPDGSYQDSFYSQEKPPDVALILREAKYGEELKLLSKEQTSKLTREWRSEARTNKARYEKARKTKEAQRRRQEKQEQYYAKKSRSNLQKENIAIIDRRYRFENQPFQSSLCCPHCGLEFDPRKLAGRGCIVICSRCKLLGRWIYKSIQKISPLEIEKFNPNLALEIMNKVMDLKNQTAFVHQTNPPPVP